MNRDCYAFVILLVESLLFIVTLRAICDWWPTAILPATLGLLGLHLVTTLVAVAIRTHAARWRRVMRGGVPR